MADRLPMPRMTLKRRPSASTDSPGLSSVPASMEPIMQHEAPGGQRLHHVARILDAAVGDDRDVARAAHRVHDGGDLRHPDAGDHPRGADAARPDAHLHRVHPAPHHLAGAFLGGHVAGDELHVGEGLPQEATASAARPRCGRARNRSPARRRRRPPAPWPGSSRRACRPPRPPPGAGRAGPCWRRGAARRLKMSLTVISPLEHALGVHHRAASRSGAWPGSAPRPRGWCPPGR